MTIATQNNFLIRRQQRSKCFVRFGFAIAMNITDVKSKCEGIALTSEGRFGSLPAVQ
jgi:hypothetical protein